MQKKAIRLITFLDFDADTSPLFFELKLLKPQDHIKLQTLYFMHQFFTGELPKIFDSFVIKTSDKHNLIFDTMDLYLWNETDERFKILTLHSIKRELSMHFIKFY